MTTLVPCRHCSHNIHQSAIACPQCGAPTQQKTEFNTATKIENYDQVPWFRRRWFAIVCFLLFMPAFLLIAFTGDIYFEKKGELKTVPKNAKFIILGIFFAMVFIQIAVES